MTQEGENGLESRESSNVHNEDRYTHVDKDIVSKSIEGYSETKEEEIVDNNPENHNKNVSSKAGQMKTEIKKIKVILLGEIGSGKTSLINKFVNNKFSESEKKSGPVEQKKIINLDDNLVVELTINDTTEEEKLGKFTKNYYKDAHGALLVFDLTNQQSFEKLKFWMEEINAYAPRDIVLCIVGNKSDLRADGKVKYEDAKDFAKDNLYYEVSCKSGHNISLAFEQLAYGIIEKQKEEENNPNKVIRGKEGRKTADLNQINEELKSLDKKNKCCNIF